MNYKSSAPVAQLGGAKRKNGHKSNCSCHICENMKNKAKRGGYKEDEEKAQLKKMGGSKKKNGHKPDCKCPICKNMKNKKNKTHKRGGADDTDSDSDSDSDKEEIKTGGKKKKSNGHKANCKCPICKNMKKKSRKGGADMEDGLEYDGLENIPDASPVETIPNASLEAYPEIIPNASPEAYPEASPKGGTRKRRGAKKSNGHKANCKCPICKNMQKSKKTRRKH